jgi:hypothetical protein
VVLLLVIARRGGRRDLAVLGALVAGACLWVGEVALMTSDGFSGNIRYLVMPAAIACLAGGVGAGRLVRAVLGRRAAGAGPAALAAAVALGVAYAAPTVQSGPSHVQAITFQARVNAGVATAVARSGGAARLRACGDVYTGPFQVPVVAWHLHVHTTLVESTPPQRPAVVFRAKSTPPERPRPSLRSLGDQSSLRTLATAPGWRVVAVCRRGA